MMIKEAIEYVVGLGAAKVKDVSLASGGMETYSDKPLYRLEKHVPVAEKIYLNTLTGLIDYIKSNIDTMAEKMIVEVQSPTVVHLYSQLNEKRDREYLVETCAMCPEFSFNSFINQEAFCIAMQSKFISNDDREAVLRFAGTIESGTIAQYGDDGVTQKATIKTGLASKGEAILPNPVNLKPYRTFMEVDQPESDFIFRMKENECSGGGIYCAIFEADGGAWKMKAMQNIKEYLQNELDGLDQFTVIA